MLRAIIFDFDGVIVDSEPMHERALRAASRALGMDFTHEQNMARYIGCDDRDAYARICEDNGRMPIPAEFEELSRLKWEFAQQAISRGEVPGYPGTLRLIEEARNALTIAVCSGARLHEIQEILGRLALESAFKAVISADHVAKAKPDPTGYLMTASKIGVSPSQCIAIEDTPRGIAAAKAAGLFAIGVCHTLAASRLEQADAVVDSTAELSAARLRELWTAGS
ncbi:MAG: HAD family phosphatase [Planctomycetes bacterium]|nr:HAD family phosphatase [Planctomycetota bacterium]